MAKTVKRIDWRKRAEESRLEINRLVDDYNKLSASHNELTDRANANYENGREWQRKASDLEKEVRDLRDQMEDKARQHRSAAGDALFWHGVACGMDPQKAEAAKEARHPSALVDTLYPNLAQAMRR